MGTHSHLGPVEAGEDHAADADEEGEDAEPPVDGEGGALRDVDPGPLVPDGCGGW